MADWITTAEAAELTGYHNEYLRKLIREGKITATKKGTMWWVDKASLLAYWREAETHSDKRHGPKGEGLDNL